MVGKFMNAPLKWLIFIIVLSDHSRKHKGWKKSSTKAFFCSDVDFASHGISNHVPWKQIYNNVAQCKVSEKTVQRHTDCGFSPQSKNLSVRGKKAAGSCWQQHGSKKAQVLSTGSTGRVVSTVNYSCKACECLLWALESDLSFMGAELWQDSPFSTLGLSR